MNSSISIAYANDRVVALFRYQEIVDASDSFDLDFDSLGSGKTKPSKAAIRVNDLLEATTGKRTLESSYFLANER